MKSPFARILRPRIPRRRLVLLAAGSCLVAAAAGIAVWVFSGGPKFMRSDCIVRLEIEHPPGSDIRAAESLLFDVMSDYALASKLPISGFSYGNPDRSSVYVVYRDRCEEKFELTGLIAQSYARQQPQGVQVTITQDIVQPSMDTVIFDGDAWIDGTPMRRHELGLD